MWRLSHTHNIMLFLGSYVSMPASCLDSFILAVDLLVCEDLGQCEVTTLCYLPWENLLCKPGRGKNCPAVWLNRCSAVISQCHHRTSFCKVQPSCKRMPRCVLALGQGKLHSAWLSRFGLGWVVAGIWQCFTHGWGTKKQSTFTPLRYQIRSAVTQPESGMCFIGCWRQRELH